MDKFPLKTIRKYLLALFMVTLPLTNFPYFPRIIIGGSANVRPLMIYPLLLLLVFLTLPAILHRELPRDWLPFLLFMGIVFIVSGIPFLQGFESEIREASVLSRVLRSVITLFMGAAVYMTISVSAENEPELEFALRWLYYGLILALVWGTLQIIGVLELIPQWYFHMAHIQKYLTMNVGSPDRIMGLTLEPSWFADQITTLWLPWVLPAVLLNKTLYHKRWGWLTVEKILLPWMGLVLLFTLSRSGFGVAAIVLCAGVLLFRNPDRTPWLKTRRGGVLGSVQEITARIPEFLRVVIVSLLAVGILVLLVYFASMQSNYIYRMWEYWLKPPGEFGIRANKNLGDYFRYIGFGPRFVYWETAFRTFLKHPLLGVGLGNFTFHYLENIPPVQVGYMPELLTRIVPGNNRVITPKNYFARLLAETGILGTAAFATFLAVLAIGGLTLWLSGKKDQRFWGAGALLGLLAFVVGGFSIDSLAIPNSWVVFGFITAAVQVYWKRQ